MPSPEPDSEPMPADLVTAHSTLYGAGLSVRTAVAGPEHVSRSLAQNSSPFSRPMQELATEAGWGWVWTRPGLERETRSMLCIAMLCALNRMAELACMCVGRCGTGAPKRRFVRSYCRSRFTWAYQQGCE